MTANARQTRSTRGLAARASGGLGAVASRDDGKSAAGSALRLVPDPSARASSGTFAIFVGAVLALGLLGLLAVNTMLEQGAFAQQRLSTRQTALTHTEQALEQQVLVLQSPQNLAAAARALGMVAAGTPAFLQLGTGRVLGVAGAVGVPVVVRSGATGAGTAATTTKATTTATPTARATVTASKATAAKPSKAPKPATSAKPKPSGAPRAGASPSPTSNGGAP